MDNYTRETIEGLISEFTPEEIYDYAKELYQTNYRTEWRNEVNHCIDVLIDDAQEFLTALFGRVPDYKVLEDYAKTLDQLADVIEAQKFGHKAGEQPIPKVTKEEVKMEGMIKDIFSTLDDIFNKK